jgi:hypothetical protein
LPEQVELQQLSHFSLDSAYEGLVAVDGLPALLCARRLPALRCVALSGLSLVPLSTLSQPLRCPPTPASPWIQNPDYQMKLIMIK